MEHLAGKTAVVTGATSGIGRAITLALAREGVSLYLIGRDSDRLKYVRQEAEGAAAHVRTYCANLASAEDVDAVASRIDGDCSGVDILVHSAGYIAPGSIETTAAVDVDRHYMVNVRAPYVLTQRFLPGLRRQQGQVVFINSSICLQPGRRNLGAYAASKHALKAISDSLREEVNSQGIRVLSVYPGRTASPMQAALHEVEGKHYQPERLLQPEDIAEIVVHSLLLPRTAEVSDVSVRPFQTF